MLELYRNQGRFGSKYPDFMGLPKALELWTLRNEADPLVSLPRKPGDTKHSFTTGNSHINQPRPISTRYRNNCTSKSQWSGCKKGTCVSKATTRVTLLCLVINANGIMSRAVDSGSSCSYVSVYVAAYFSDT